MKAIYQYTLFRALRSRNYALYLTGRAASQFGTWMQRTAVVWLVYSMTHSAFLIGVSIFAEQFPSFICSIPGGVAADRYNRYNIIKITQIASMAQSVLLAVLVITGHAQIWSILSLSIFLGVVNAFDVPARQALISDVVASYDDLPNALSLSTATASLAQLLGPALSGIVLTAFGAGVCFLLNAASFAAVIISLLLMNLPAYKHIKTDKKVIEDIIEGFRYVKGGRNISMVALMLAVISLLVLPYSTVLPVFAKVVFSGGASTFGYINSFVGIGAVAGTIYLASRKPGADLKKILFFSTVLLAIGLICFSQIKNFPVALLFAAVAGYGAMAQFTISNIIVQSEASPEMRGRALGILLMATFGMIPIGSLLIGGVSEYIGAPATVLAQGITALAIAAVFFKFLTGRLSIAKSR